MWLSRFTLLLSAGRLKSLSAETIDDMRAMPLLEASVLCRKPLARLQPAPSEVGRIDEGLERRRILSVVAASGAKLRQDSGGRLLVIESSGEADQILQRELPGVRIERIDEGVSERIPGLDPSDALFAQALAITSSQEYREGKRTRKPVESPAEQLLHTAPRAAVAEAQQA
jgi:hypothetical protein